jgi:hypothetical protein
MRVTGWMGMGLVGLVGCGKATRSGNHDTTSGSTTNTATSTTGALLDIGGLAASITNAATTSSTATNTTSSTASGGTDGTGTLDSGSGGAGGNSVTGSAGAAGADPMGYTYAFDEGVESWEAQYMADGVDEIELGWSIDATLDGALLASLHFSDITARQRFAGFGVSVDGLDLSSATITAEVRQLSSGDNAENQAQIYVRTGNSVVAHGPLTSLSEIDTWYTLRFTLAEPLTVFNGEESYDPTNVHEIGVEFRGSVTALSTVMFSIDNVSY